MALTKGLKPTERKLATTTNKRKLQANQWQNTPQQNKFMQLYIMPSSGYFGNAYQAALASNYSPSYARRIASSDTANKWLSDFVNFAKLTPEHIMQGLQDMYLNPSSYNNSKSPGDTRLKALEIMAKVSGMVDKVQTTVTIVQPILGGASMKTTTKASATVLDGQLVDDDMDSDSTGD